MHLVRAVRGAVAVEREATPTSTSPSRVDQLWAGVHTYAPPAILAVCTVLLFWSAAQVFFVGDD
jgi:hypothetical protein